MQKLVIFGTGGMAREAHQIVEDINAAAPAMHFLGFLDGNRACHGQQVHGYPVLGDIDWLLQPAAQDVALVVAVGNTVARRKIVDRVRRKTQAGFVSLVHPRAWIGNRVRIGPGSIICAGAMITTDIDIGCHVIVNIGATLTHDGVLSDYVTLAPGAHVSGAVRIGEGSDIGSGSTIIQGRALGQWSIIGAGAVVIRDVAPNVTAVGNPARIIQTRPSGWHLE